MKKNIHLTHTITRSLALATLAIFMILPGVGWGQITVAPGTGFNLDGQGTGIYATRPSGANFTAGTNEVVLQIVSKTFTGAAIDFDGDGNAEIIVQTVGNLGSAVTQTRLYIFEAEGNNDFRQRATVLIDQGTNNGSAGLMRGVDVGDVDGDGALEMVSASGVGSNSFLSIYDINTSTFAFTELAQQMIFGTGGLFSTNGTINQLRIVANKNGTSNSDILVSNATGTTANSQIFALEYTGSAIAFVNTTAANSGLVVNSGVIAFNHANMGDAADEEIVMATEIAGNALVIREYVTSGTSPFGTAKTITTNWTGTTTGSFTTIAIGDIDGDGDLDAVAGDYNGKVLRGIRRTGVDTYTSEATIAALTTFSPATEISDIDNDGKKEIIYANGTSVVYREHDGTANDFSSAHWGAETTILSGLVTGTSNAVSFVGGSSTTLDNDRNFDVVVGRSAQVTGQGDLDDDEVFFIEANRTFTSGTIAAGNYDNVLIQTGTVTSSGNLTTNGSLTITAPGTLTISSGGSLITYGSVSGITTVERFIAGASNWSSALTGWHLLSSPVASQAISPNFTDATPANYDFYAWDEASNTWLNQKVGGNVITTFITGKGYLVAYAASGTKQFNGTLNTASVNVSGLTQSSGANKGWHLLGNPFPSALKWNDGNWALTNITTTAKVWNEAGAAYVDKAANAIIPAMNGFMVETSGGGSLTIPTAARVHDATAFYKSSSETAIKLVAHDTENQTAQESIIRVNENAGDEFNPAFDSHFLAGFAPQFYSVKNGENLSTQNIPGLDSRIIPMGFVKNTATAFSIELVTDLLMPNTSVYLRDKLTGSTQNLVENPVYSFTSAEGDDPNRFELSFANFTAVDKPQTSAINVYYDGVQFHIATGKLQGKAVVTVYDVTGRSVYGATMHQGATNLEFGFSKAPGVYFVNVKSDTGSTTRKVVIR